MMKFYILLLLLAIAIVTAGVAMSNAGGDNAASAASSVPALGAPGPGQPWNYAGATAPIAALSADPLADLASMAEAARVVSNVRFSTTTSYGPPPDTEGQAPLTHLEFDVAVPDSTPAARAKGAWEGAIFVGAVADRFAASGLPPVGEIGITLVTPDGTRLDAPGGIGSVVAGQRFADVTSAVTAAIVQRAEALGFTDVDVSTLRGIQEALVITLRSTDPVSAINGTPNLLERLLGEPSSTYEGVYLEVQNATGEPVMSEGRAPRDGSGSVWTAPNSGVKIAVRDVLRSAGGA